MKQALKSFFNFCRNIIPHIQIIKQAGGTAYLVGGCVRDLVLNQQLKDFDIEVHGLKLAELEKILQSFGTAVLVGKQFGVLKLTHLDVDWSLPRKDSKGRKPKVVIDPAMTIEQACRRRDLTMNAMAINLNCVADNFENLFQKKDFDPVHDLKIIDPYGGLDDIKKKQLRAVNTQLFLEDPLRFFRVMQFVGRFEMMPNDELNQLCATMQLHDEATKASLARERIWDEIKKLFLKSNRPSLGFRWLKDIGRLKDVFPELYATSKIKQHQDHHPEGDVFEHTMQSLDAAAQCSLYQETEGQSLDQEKFMIMLAVLCHDLGKVSTTTKDLRARGHEKESARLAKQLLKRVTTEVSMIESVQKLVTYHLLPCTFLAEGAKEKAYKRLANKLAPHVSLRQLGLVALADKQGRNPLGDKPLEAPIGLFNQFLKRAEQADVLDSPEEPVLLGRHLLDDIEAGPEMGRLLKEAYQIQIDEGIIDLKELKKRVLS